jgi:Cu2+-containing amine oxidase
MIKPVTLLTAVLLLFTAAANAQATNPYPLDPLTAAEMKQVVKILKDTKTLRSHLRPRCLLINQARLSAAARHLPAFMIIPKMA